MEPWCSNMGNTGNRERYALFCFFLFRFFFTLEGKGTYVLTFPFSFFFLPLFLSFLVSFSLLARRSFSSQILFLFLILLFAEPYIGLSNQECIEQVTKENLRLRKPQNC